MTGSKKPASKKTRMAAMNVDAPEDRSEDSSRTRLSRQKEKEQLSGLNDRLASYIERVRNLETENQHLRIQFHDIEEVQQREKSETVECYEERVNDLRRQLDAVTREKAKIDLERHKALSDHSLLNERATKAERELDYSRRESDHRFEQLQNLTGRLMSAENAKEQLAKENQKLKKEIEKILKNAELYRRQLEEQIVLRSELEGRIAAYKDEIGLVRRSYTKEVDELRRKRQVEFTSLNAEVESHYQSKLQEQLQAMRHEFDARIANNRDELEQLYANKLADSTSAMQKLEQTVREMSAANSKLIADYQDLLDLKVQMGTELQAYQKLLEGEENRLNLAPSSTSSHGSAHSTAIARSGAKRKRVCAEGGLTKLIVSSNSCGPVVIGEVDREGKFIRLENRGGENIPIGGWIIKCIGGAKEVFFKFKGCHVFDANTSTTVWSNNAGHEHSPPSHIAMKSQTWPDGMCGIRAELISTTNELQAWYQLSLTKEEENEGANDDESQCCII